MELLQKIALELLTENLRCAAKVVAAESVLLSTVPSGDEYAMSFKMTMLGHKSVYVQIIFPSEDQFDSLATGEELSNIIDAWVADAIMMMMKKTSV